MFYALIASCYMKVSQNINFTKDAAYYNDIVFSPLKQSTTQKMVYRALNAQQQLMNRKELKLSNFLSVCFKVKIVYSFKSFAYCLECMCSKAG